MAVQSESTIQRFRGLSTDKKPERLDGDKTVLKTGSTFTEIDTGERYVWTRSGDWVRQEQTIETMFEELMVINLAILRVLEATHQGHEEHLWEENVEIESEF